MTPVWARNSKTNSPCDSKNGSSIKARSYSASALTLVTASSTLLKDLNASAPIRPVDPTRSLMTLMRSASLAGVPAPTTSLKFLTPRPIALSTSVINPDSSSPYLYPMT